MTIRVVPTPANPTIQAAINNADPGDSIQILAGTFDGFEVDKPRLKIFGCGVGKTIITGTPAIVNMGGVVVNADRTTLEKMTIQGFSGENGLLVLSNNNFFKQIESSFNTGPVVDGFQLAGDRNLTIDCIASFNTEDGFDFAGSVRNYTMNCQSFRNGDKGYRISAMNNKLTSNSAKNNEDGFFVNENENILFNNQSFKNNNRGFLIGTNHNNNNLMNNFACNNNSSGIQIESATTENVLDVNIVRKNGISGLGSGIFIQNGATDSSIRFNKLKLNNPFDIQAIGNASTDNTFDGNICDNSFPIGLCT
ncbi:right-handed parallel beta-helix repeat-containing protein [Bacillus spongiae]|uniref:Right-handed parallel beta-helix repeat-containing protein n=1 Tax=Bacillus spongiae TaxID=2683610 RepID=A0ABU8HCI1_9BACI